MTEARGRSAKWNTALLLVPGAAAMVGGAVAWAANTTPTFGGSSTPQQPAVASPVADATVSAQQAAVRRQLEQQLGAHRKHTARLEHRLKALRVKTAQLQTSNSGTLVAAPAGGSGGYSGGGSSGGGRPRRPRPRSRCT